MAAVFLWDWAAARSIHADYFTRLRTMPMTGRGIRWRIAIWGGAAFLLLLPLVAMQFTDEVNWDETDFIVFGAMLAVACGTYEIAARMTGNSSYRLAVGVAVATAFVLVWMSLAVGIIGTEDDPANLMYGGVLAVGVVGGIVVRFQPDGMALALVAMAIAQLLVAVIALSAGLGFPWSGPPELLMLNGSFAALWLLSAWLFRRAARLQSSARAAR
jgi:hypothetical protein